MKLATRPTKPRTTADRGLTDIAPLPAAGADPDGAAPLEVDEAAGGVTEGAPAGGGTTPVGLEPAELAAPPGGGGVNGTVLGRPGSSVDWTLAVKASKVLSPVVGGLIAPNMPPLQ